jgi:hypothetical protein
LFQCRPHTKTHPLPSLRLWFPWSLSRFIVWCFEADKKTNRKKWYRHRANLGEDLKEKVVSLEELTGLYVKAKTIPFIVIFAPHYCNLRLQYNFGFAGKSLGPPTETSHLREFLSVNLCGS